jgi:hypothetical protein
LFRCNPKIVGFSPSVALYARPGDTGNPFAAASFPRVNAQRLADSESMATPVIEPGQSSTRQARIRSVALAIERKTGEQAQVRTLLLVLVCFLLGLGAGAYWYYRATHRHLTNTGEAGSKLAESTKAVLKTLAAPVEIRFYSLLDPASTSDDLRNFAGRVDQLLSAYEQEAGGRLKVARRTAQSDANAASADGVKAFNLDKGDACFLGAAIACKDQKETLGQLSPEWEAALESDLSRAIARVTAAKPAATSTATSTAQTDAAVIAEVKRAIPNLDSVSLVDGKQILRAAALKEIMEAMEKMQQRLKEAQQRISQVQTSGSEAEQQAALKQLQQVQAEQTEKLKEVSARVQAQIQALEQIKGK